MTYMKIQYLWIIPLVFLGSCSAPPEKEDYIGVYRIIKILDGEEKIQISPLLNHIELTAKAYIYRMDRDGNNQFSPEEISSSPYTFALDDKETPYIWTAGNEAVIYLLDDKYYDLLFQRVDESGKITILYTNKER